MSTFHRRAGFTLIELAIVLMIVGVVTAGGIMGMEAMRQKNRMQDTRQKLATIEHALTLYVARTGKLPDAANPGGGTNSGQAVAGTTNGRVPFVDLNLTIADTIDAWGNEILYTVSSAQTSDNALACPTAAALAAAAEDDEDSDVSPWTAGTLNGTLNLRDGAGGDSPVAYILRSRGDNGIWDSEVVAGTTYLYEAGSGAQAIADFDDLVVGRDGSRILYDGGCRVEKAAASTGGTEDDNSGDDPPTAALEVTHFLNTNPLTEDNTASGATKPFEATLKNGDTAFIMGEKDTSVSGDYIKPLTTGRTACTWIQEAFRLTDEPLQVGFDFQFFPGTTTKSSTGAPADGFTLQLVPSTFDIGNESKGYVCGQGGSSLGHGTLATPKMAIEFDIYYSSWISDPKYNHIAVDISSKGNTDNSGNADLWHGTYLTPACTSPIPSKPACVWDSTMAAYMEYRNCDKNTYPACDMELVSSKVWGTSALRTRPYHAAITVSRWCNSDCSTCGASGQTKTRIQATITCLVGSATDCGTVASIDTCQSSMSDDTIWGKMRMGFSVATGAETTGVQISGAEAYGAFYFDE